MACWEMVGVERTESSIFETNHPRRLYNVKSDLKTGESSLPLNRKTLLKAPVAFKIIASWLVLNPNEFLPPDRIGLNRHYISVFKAARSRVIPDDRPYLWRKKKEKRNFNSSSTSSGKIFSKYTIHCRRIR